VAGIGFLDPIGGKEANRLDGSFLDAAVTGHVVLSFSIRCDYFTMQPEWGI
jgi:hypothetical protein